MFISPTFSAKNAAKINPAKRAKSALRAFLTSFLLRRFIKRG
jgi:hypothetical protein